MSDLRTAVQQALQNGRSAGRKYLSRGTLPNYTEDDFVLVAPEEFNVGEKLCLRWRGSRRIVKAIKDYVYQVEGLRNDGIDDIHISRLKFYHDSSPDKEVIMRHVLNSETGLVVHHLVRLDDSKERLKGQIRWRCLPGAEDALEQIKQIYKSTPALFVKSLKRKIAF